MGHTVSAGEGQSPRRVAPDGWRFPVSTPTTVPDPQWLAVHRALCPLVTPTDRILAPRADWAPFPCPVRFYDGVITLEQDTILVLHKGKLPAIDKAALAAVVAQWACLFADEHFVVFAADPARATLLRRLLRPSGHLRRVHRHLGSRELKVIGPTIYHLHLPKTGGTAVWDALSGVLPSRAYYGDGSTFLARPPAPGEYDLVGLHGSLSMIDARLREGDLVIGLLRDPVERFMSSVVHARRPGLDLATLTPQQRAMREGPIKDFLASDAGLAEVRLQSHLLGVAHDRPFESADDAAVLANATAAIERADCLFAPMAASQALVRDALARFGLEAPTLLRRNENDPVAYDRHRAELLDAAPLVAAMAAGDRRLFERVKERFKPVPALHTGLAVGPSGL